MFKGGHSTLRCTCVADVRGCRVADLVSQWLASAADLRDNVA